MTQEQEKKFSSIKEKIALTESDIVFILHAVYKSPKQKAMLLFRDMKKAHLRELEEKGRIDIDARCVPKRIVREYLADYDIVL